MKQSKIQDIFKNIGQKSILEMKNKQNKLNINNVKVI